jgi:serine/threonine-protein kinase
MAIAIDENLAEAQASVALVRQALDWDWNGAEVAFQRALQLNPNFAHARHMYSHLLMALGRVEDSLRESQCALQTDPLEPSLRCHLGWHLYNARQYEAAVTELRRALTMEPDFRPAHTLLGLALLETNKVQEAVEVLEGAPSVHRTPETLAALGYAYGKSGRAEQAQAIAAQMQDRAQLPHVSAYFVALVYIGLDDLEKALQWFERACDQHESNLMYLYVDPKHDRLRTHSQFDEMLRRLSLKLA